MDGRGYDQRYRQPYGGWPCADAARDLVVKVKYGDTLKRFNASVNGSYFDLDLPALRSKIASSFKFSPDTEFILTYTDDDGDNVMLDDDNDLRDAAVNQKLNPLRIVVQLKGKNVGAARTKQHTTNFSSPRPTSLEDQLAQVKSAIDDALKFVPEQIPAVFAKLSHDLQSRAALSAPSLAELLDRFAKLMARSSNMQPSGGSGVGSQKLGNSKAKLESAPAPTTVSPSGPSDMQNSGTPENGLKSVLLENPTAKIDQVSLSPSVEDSLVFTSLGGMKSELKRTADNGIKISSDARSKGKSVISSVPPASTTSHGAPTQRPIPVSSVRESKLMYGTNPTYTSCGSNGTANGGLRSLFPPPPVFHPRSPVFPPYNPTFGANGKTSGDMLSTFSTPSNIYPFEYTPSSVGTCFPTPYLGCSHDRMASLHCNVPNPEEKSFGSSYRGLGANYGSIPQHEQHRWVQCDGCGVTPIVGPRYKSNVKEDYDLCGACFSHIGNDAEYTRLDCPASRCNIKILERVPGLLAAKPNSLFIKDVTVPDGTPMAPSHPFTKIWRVCNNGSTSWPYGTQLVWVGGDHLASPSSVRLAISVYGRINPCEETDVTVDFLAPARPGRYISYWRLALPSGQKFGQQIWVHIKVEQPIQSSGGKQAAAMNLNQIPEANSTKLKPFAVDIETNRVSSEPFYRCPGIPEANNTKQPSVLDRLKLKPSALELETNSVSSEPFYRCPGIPEANSTKQPSVFDRLKLKPSVLDLETNSVSSEPFSRCPGSFRETMKLKEVKPAPSDVSSVPTAAEPTPGRVPASEAFPQPNPVPMLPVSSSEPVVDHVSIHAPAAAIAPVPAAPLPEQIINHLEEKLMTELEGLGFMQADLNKQILRQNNYDLEQSVAHLCDYDEWDALEFAELGFDDAEMNKEVVDNSDEEGFIVADLVTKAANDH